MKIDNLFMPSSGINKGAEEAIVALGASGLLEEVRKVIFGTNVFLNPTRTSTGTKGGERGKTGNKGLTPAINKYLSAGLTALGWHSYQPKRAPDIHIKIDWYKSTPDPYWAKMGGIGIGVETQFGNNFQAHADILRLQLAFNTFELGAGIIIVPSDDLSKYLADRCANFSNTSSKLRQHFDAMAGARAFHICPIGIIGVAADGFIESGEESFRLESEWVQPGMGEIDFGEDGDDDDDEPDEPDMPPAKGR